jgi:glycosyltransferase involved in cell wall biosynthesis
MRVLVISPIFPPVSDAEAICAGKFVQALMDYGIAASVILSTNARSSLRRDTSMLWKSVETVSFDVPNRPGAPVLLRGWLGLRYHTTSWAVWTQAAVAKARELDRQTPFDLVVSRSLPHHGHLAGYWVASALQIPWVANFNDPWDLSPFVSTESHRKEWTPDLNWKVWRRRIFARADALTFPCERLRDLCFHGSPRQANALIVPHIGTASACVRMPSDFVIVHAGKLGINDVTGRSATALLGGLAELFQLRPAARSNTRLVFVGPEDPETVEHIAARGLSENVVCTGLVNYEESLRYVADAAVCVLVEGDFKEGVFLPSKLCDYIAARKPVLALSPKTGTVADLASEGGIRCVTPQDSIGVAHGLVELFDAFTQSRLQSYQPPEQLIRRFEGKTVIHDFLTSVARLTNNTIARSECVDR